MWKNIHDKANQYLPYMWCSVRERAVTRLKLCFNCSFWWRCQVVVKCYVNQSNLEHNYRPRTKYEGRYCFHKCLSVWMVRGHPISGLRGGGTPSRSGWWGVPHPRPGVGVPQPGLDGGGTLARSWWWGIPHPKGGGYLGYPSQVWMVGGTPHPGMGYPS